MKVRWLKLYLRVALVGIFEQKFELHHALLDPNAHRQCARPSLYTFILKELYAAEREGLARETTCKCVPQCTPLRGLKQSSHHRAQMPHVRT